MQYIVLRLLKCHFIFKGWQMVMYLFRIIDMKNKNSIAHNHICITPYRDHAIHNVYLKLMDFGTNEITCVFLFSNMVCAVFFLFFICVWFLSMYLCPFSFRNGILSPNQIKTCAFYFLDFRVIVICLLSLFTIFNQNNCISHSQKIFRDGIPCKKVSLLQVRCK